MRKLAILLIDDDEDFALSLALVLEDEGHVVGVTHSIGACVARYRERPYDLVMIDARLRGESGLDCYEQLRAINGDVQAVMMTGYSVEDVLSRALEAGVRKVLRKPFSEDELLRTLEGVG